MTNSLSNILVTGADGQVAIAMRQILPQAKYFRKQEWDILDPIITERIFNLHHPAIVINTAAYTQVDKAETQCVEANAVNHLGAQQLAMACQKYKVRLIHLSTDYVFAGDSTIPYGESDPTSPINFYGSSKCRGEEAIRAHCAEALILRISGVFSEYKQNFLTTILKLAKEKNELRIVADQLICPTYASDIALTIAALSKQTFIPGTYHYTSHTVTSWHAFCVAIIAELRQYTNLTVENIIAVSSADYQTTAKRPTYSILNCDKIATTFAISQPSWQTGIQKAISRLNYA